MVRGTIWGREVEMQGSPLTYLWYKREFGGDLGQDLADTYAKGKADSETMLRFAWAMAKTHDPSISGYEGWLSEFDPEEFSVLQPPVGVVDSAVVAELFRVRQATFAERVRGRIARWLDRLSKRARPEAPRLLPGRDG